MAIDVKLGVSTWIWTSPFSTQQAPDLFKKIAELGYNVVEIAVEDPTLIDAKKIKMELSRLRPGAADSQAICTRK